MNHFEQTARAAKVQALLARVPPATGPVQNAAVAFFLAEMTTAQRAELAKQCGVREPSDQTWQALIDAVYLRGRHV